MPCSKHRFEPSGKTLLRIVWEGKPRTGSNVAQSLRFGRCDLSMASTTCPAQHSTSSCAYWFHSCSSHVQKAASGDWHDSAVHHHTSFLSIVIGCGSYLVM